MLTELLLASLAVYRVLFNSKLTDSSSPLNEDIPIRETTAPVVGSEESRSASAVTKDISSSKYLCDSVYSEEDESNVHWVTS